MDDPKLYDVAVIGGGLAGLAAGALAAQAGRRVIVLEKGKTIGGRAATQTKQGFSFNQGPHALYRTSAGMPMLKKLGITPAGGPPVIAGSFAFDRDSLHTLPGGFVSLLTTSLLGLPGKLELGKLLPRLPQIDAAAIAGTSFERWLERNCRDPGVRRFLRALARLTTYSADSEAISAGAVVAQIQMALGGGVLYLDQGWQTLVEALVEALRRGGGLEVANARVVDVEPAASGFRIRRAEGTETSARSVIVALPVAAAAEVVAGGRHPRLRAIAERARPVRAACLDLALRTVPRPRARFALGIDRPLYFSLHSAAAKLAPEGGALIHAARYLSGEEDGGDAAAELEAFVDRLQPGWREQVVERRFLPHLLVASDLPAAAHGGLAGRPSAIVEDLPGLYLAGDWVGPRAMLADASLASAEDAARAALERTAERTPVAA